jgi:methylglyoxal synthase
MINEPLPIPPKKRIALVAHDNKKQDLLEWARFNRGSLIKHDLCATGTTGTLLEKTLAACRTFSSRERMTYA